MTMSCERIAPDSMPAVMCLDAEGATLFATVSARNLCEQWNRGLTDREQPLDGQDFRLPASLGDLLRDAAGKGLDVNAGGIRVRHPHLPELAVTIQMGGSLPEMQTRPYCVLMFVAGAGAPAEIDSDAERTLRQLTPSERRVALLVAEGLRNEEIAQRLQRSRRTIEYQLNAIFRKLDMTRRTQLVRVLV
ncbi:MAG TPA: helix-turn-helix transcriptional regulator [Povalibacter sp.]|nr:helix-turn-helix transcriptional regulator [Povalibacter sp.]